MAAITWPDVVAIAPELASLSVTAQTLILDHVNTALNVSVFGGEASPKLRLARVFLAAHYGTVATTGGAVLAGPVTAESAGGLSRSYATTFATDAFGGPWGSTAYGQSFAALLRSSPARLPVVS